MADPADARSKASNPAEFDELVAVGKPMIQDQASARAGALVHTHEDHQDT
jgi:hypothetical protein